MVFPKEIQIKEKCDLLLSESLKKGTLGAPSSGLVLHSPAAACQAPWKPRPWDSAKRNNGLRHRASQQRPPLTKKVESSVHRCRGLLFGYILNLFSFYQNLKNKSKPFWKFYKVNYYHELPLGFFPPIKIKLFHYKTSQLFSPPYKVYIIMEMLYLNGPYWEVKTGRARQRNLSSK